MDGAGLPSSLPGRDVVRMLDLAPHPEGGHYRETFRDTRCDAEGRPASTAILFLLAGDDVSEWHRIDAAEVWHHYAGAPLVLTMSPNGHDASTHRLGPAFDAGQTPQFVVPAGCWQTAVSLGAWTLMGCTVAPGFRFEGFELAPPGWRPTPRK